MVNEKIEMFRRPPYSHKSVPVHPGDAQTSLVEFRGRGKIGWLRIDHEDIAAEKIWSIRKLKSLTKLTGEDQNLRRVQGPCSL